MSPTSPKSLDDLLELPYKKVPLSKIFDNTSISNATMVSKLIKSRDPRIIELNRRNGDITGNNQSRLYEIYSHIKRRLDDNENILKIYPDLELIEQILVSSIISPKDMVSNNLLFRMNDTPLPSEYTARMLRVVEEHLLKVYKLEEEMPDIISKALMKTGSYIKVIIPEASVDDLINTGQSIGLESLNDIYQHSTTTNQYTEVFNSILGDNDLVVSKRNKEPVVGLERLNNPDVSFMTEPTVVLPSFEYTHITKKGDEESKDTKVMESINLSLTVTDNPQILKLPIVLEGNARHHIDTKLYRKGIPNVGNEKLTDGKVDSKIYKTPRTRLNVFQKVKTKDGASRLSKGRPLIIDAPSESCIPVFRPGKEQDPIGYYFLLDADGSFINYTSASQNTNYLDVSNQNITSYMLKRASMNLSVSEDQLTITDLMLVYSSLIETELKERIKNGAYRMNVELGNNEELYRIMLARSLANQQTKVLFIPAELVTYFAFRYHKNGVGKSLIDNVKVLLSLGAMLLFAKINGEAKNAIMQRIIKIKFDPDDPDPDDTLEKVVHRVFSSLQNGFPVGIVSPTDISEWCIRQAINVEYEGHPELPDMKVDYETRSLEHGTGNTELYDEIMKRITNSFGLTPETVSQAKENVEFATTITQNNLLYSKRSAKDSKNFSKHASSFVKKVVINDTCIYDQLYDIIKQNADEITKFLKKSGKENLMSIFDQDGIMDDDDTINIDNILSLFINNIVVELPLPDSAPNQKLKELFEEQYNAYSFMVDNAFLDEGSISSDLTGEFSQYLTPLKKTILAYLMRQWALENGYMKEIFKLTNIGDNNKPEIDMSKVIETHIEGLTKTVKGLMVKLNKIKEDSNKLNESDSSMDGDQSDYGSGEETSEEQPSETNQNEEDTTKEHVDTQEQQTEEEVSSEAE